MSEKAAPREPMRWLKLGVGVIGGIFAAIFLLAAITIGPVQLAGEFGALLFFGWVNYLREVLPRVVFNREIAGEGLLALGLAIFGLHRVLRWWACETGVHPVGPAVIPPADSGTEPPPIGATPWRLAWTIKITAAVLLLFATSIAATGIVHQIGWFFSAQQLVYNSGFGPMTREVSHLMQVATALRVYANDFDGKCPAHLDELLPDYMETRLLFYSSLSQTEPPERILYFPFAGNKPPDDWIVVAGPHPSTKGRRSIAHSNGRFAVIQESEFQKRIAAQKSGAPIHPDPEQKIEQ